MCGITGLLYKDGTKPEKRLVQAMSRTLYHRGPDEEGYYFDSCIGFGIQRLKVIDLNTGTQPIHNEDKTIWTILNGEIYNYKDLKKTLINKGHKFYTKSDTETIVHAYEEWGLNFAEHLNGIFGLALWDKNNQRFILARDRLGVKPLYYYDTPNMVIFGSEIKAILLHPDVQADIDFEAFSNYFHFAYTPAPLTMFKNIKKLLPGHILVFEKGMTRITKYWDVQYKIEEHFSEQDWLKKLDSLMKSAVKKQLISDVPVGLFLSGGIDSSILAYLISQVSEHSIKTFSIAYKEKHYDESGYAKLVADHFHTDHYEFVVQPDIIETLPKIVEHLDEPLANSTALATLLLSELTKKKVTVALNGAGGDEIFGGYDRHRRENFLYRYTKIPKVLRTLILTVIDKLIPGSNENITDFKRRVRMITNSANMSLSNRYIEWTSVLSADCREMILTDNKLYSNSLEDSLVYIKSYFNNSNIDDLSKMLYVDTKTYLVDDILTMTDNMSMAHGLEIRVPFLDHEVVEFAATIPAKYKVKSGRSKYLLRNYLAKTLPKDIWDRPKQGFNVPISSWFRKDKYFEYAMDTILNNRNRNRGLFNVNGIENILIEHKNGNKDYGDAIWLLLNFELWCQRYLDT